MGQNVMSPVQVKNLTVLGASFNITSDAQHVGNTVTVNVSMVPLNDQSGIDEKSTDAYCKRVVTVNALWYEDATQQKKTCEAMCSVGVLTVLAGFPDYVMTDDEQERYMTEMTLQVAFGKIRSYIETMTAESQFGKLSIPLIDPAAYLESL